MIGLGVLAWIVGADLDLPRRLDGASRASRPNRTPPRRRSTTGCRFGRYRDVATRRRARCRSQTAFTNSLVVVLVSTLIVLLLALPAAYALAIRPVHKWRDVLFFFISTKFLPVVASIFPIYVYAEKWNLIGTRHDPDRPLHRA